MLISRIFLSVSCPVVIPVTYKPLIPEIAQQGNTLGAAGTEMLKTRNSPGITNSDMENKMLELSIFQKGSV